MHDVRLAGRCLLGLRTPAKNAVSTYQEDDMIEEVIERLKRQDKQVKALEEIVALEETWPQWEHRCLYESSRNTAIEALKANT